MTAARGRGPTSSPASNARPINGVTPSTLKNGADTAAMLSDSGVPVPASDNGQFTDPKTATSSTERLRVAQSAASPCATSMTGSARRRSVCQSTTRRSWFAKPNGFRSTACTAPNMAVAAPSVTASRAAARHVKRQSVLSVRAASRQASVMRRVSDAGHSGGSLRSMTWAPQHCRSVDRPWIGLEQPHAKVHAPGDSLVTVGVRQSGRSQDRHHRAPVRERRLQQVHAHERGEPVEVRVNPHPGEHARGDEELRRSIAGHVRQSSLRSPLAGLKACPAYRYTEAGAATWRPARCVFVM